MYNFAYSTDFAFVGLWGLLSPAQSKTAQTKRLKHLLDVVGLNLAKKDHNFTWSRLPKDSDANSRHGGSSDVQNGKIISQAGLKQRKATFFKSEWSEGGRNREEKCVVMESCLLLFPDNYCDILGI